MTNEVVSEDPLNEADDTLAGLLGLGYLNDFKTLEEVCLELGREFQRKNNMKGRIEDLEQTLEDYEAEIKELEADLKREKNNVIVAQRKAQSPSEALLCLAQYYYLEPRDLERAVKMLYEEQRNRQGNYNYKYNYATVTSVAQTSPILTTYMGP